MKRYLHDVDTLGPVDQPDAVRGRVQTKRSQGWTLLSTYVVDGQVVGIFETWKKSR